MKVLRTVGALAATLALAGASILPAAAAPGIALDKESGLAAEDTVTVTITGLDPAKHYRVAQCEDFKIPVQGPPVCAKNAIDSFTGKTELVVKLPVSSAFKGGVHGLPKDVDCKSSQCVIAVSQHPVGGPPVGALEVSKRNISFA